MHRFHSPIIISVNISKWKKKKHTCLMSCCQSSSTPSCTHSVEKVHNSVEEKGRPVKKVLLSWKLYVFTYLNKFSSWNWIMRGIWGYWKGRRKFSMSSVMMMMMQKYITQQGWERAGQKLDTPSMDQEKWCIEILEVAVSKIYNIVMPEDQSEVHKSNNTINMCQGQIFT